MVTKVTKVSHEHESLKWSCGSHVLTDLNRSNTTCAGLCRKHLNVVEIRLPKKCSVCIRMKIQTENLIRKLNLNEISHMYHRRLCRVKNMLAMYLKWHFRYIASIFLSLHTERLCIHDHLGPIHFTSKTKWSSFKLFQKYLYTFSNYKSQNSLFCFVLVDFFFVSADSVSFRLISLRLFRSVFISFRTLHVVGEQ